jgi:hypothetical protein
MSLSVRRPAIARAFVILGCVRIDYLVARSLRELIEPVHSAAT